MSRFSLRSNRSSLYAGEEGKRENTEGRVYYEVKEKKTPCQEASRRNKSTNK